MSEIDKIAERLRKGGFKRPVFGGKGEGGREIPINL